MPAEEAKAPALVKWRVAVEQEVLAASDVLDVAIVRPALIYGAAGSIWTVFLGPLRTAVKEGAISVELKADTDAMIGLVHVDDVVSGLQAAVEKLPLIAGANVYPVFDLVTSQESIRIVLEAAAKVLGFKGRVDLIEAEGDVFAEAMNTSFNGNSGRAMQLLGCQPKRFGYMQRMELYASAWSAS